MKSYKFYEKVEVDNIYEEITFTTSKSIYDDKICVGFLNFMKNLKSQKKLELLHNTINEYFWGRHHYINFVKRLPKK